MNIKSLCYRRHIASVISSSTYSTLQGDMFEINPSNGKISLKKLLDFESSRKIYYLNVTATVSRAERFYHI